MGIASIARSWTLAFSEKRIMYIGPYIVAIKGDNSLERESGSLATYMYSWLAKGLDLQDDALVLC